MENQQFRGLLLKLQDYLTDNDRKCLHFFFGKVVPRRIRDDPSLGGTLSLMESLFDQDKISEQDCTLLIDAFKQIRCYDAAKLLENYMKGKRGEKGTMGRLSSILSDSLHQLLEDQEDRVPIHDNFIQQQNIHTFNDNRVKSNNTNITPVTLVVNQQTNSDPSSNRNSFVSKTRLIQLCLSLLIVVLIIILGILIAFHTNGNARHEEERRSLQLQMKEMRKNNETIEKLKNEMIGWETINSNTLVKAGKTFGSVGGSAFDDSTMRHFDCSYYLRGMIARPGFSKSGFFQFLYSSSSTPDHIIEGDIRGHRSPTDDSESFRLHADEKVFKVQVEYDNSTFSVNGKYISAIMGMRFFTTEGRSSPSIDKEKTQRLQITEEFPGYTVGYVAGRSGLGVDQIQFYWYRTPTN